MQLAQSERFQDEQVQRSLKKICLVLGHGSTDILYNGV
jgi:hypothetical protein